MIQTQLLEEFGNRLSALLANSPARDFEKNAKAVLASALSRLDLVSREEFEVQRDSLARAQERLAVLEKRLLELEARKA